MDNNIIELLYKSYIEESNKFFKEKTLSIIFKKYGPLVKRYSVKYLFCNIDKEDIRQHVYMGIVKGLEDKHPDEWASTSIFRNIRKEIHNYVLRPWKNKKSSIGKDELIHFYNSSTRMESYLEGIPEYSGICKPLWDEDEAVLQMDLEEAINNLSPFQQNIMNMWLYGYGVQDIKDKILSTDSKFNTLAYYYLNQCKSIMKESLLDYKSEYAYVC